MNKADVKTKADALVSAMIPDGQTTQHRRDLVQYLLSDLKTEADWRNLAADLTLNATQLLARVCEMLEVDPREYWESMITDPSWREEQRY